MSFTYVKSYLLYSWSFSKRYYLDVSIYHVDPFQIPSKERVDVRLDFHCNSCGPVTFRVAAKGKPSNRFICNSNIRPQKAHDIVFGSKNA